MPAAQILDVRKKMKKIEDPILTQPNSKPTATAANNCFMSILVPAQGN
jgi:hypothetical protein